MATDNRPKILIVDDEPDIRSVLKTLIEGNLPGPFVKEASNGSEAIQVASNQQFDLVITDIKMPRMSGQNLINQLKGLSTLMRPRGIFVTSGHISGSALIKEVGEVTFFPKPIPTENFIQKLKLFFGLIKPEPKPQSKFDISFINPFIDATLQTLEITAGIAAKKEQVFLRGPEQISGDISAIVALNSQTYLGSFAVSFEEACFLAVVSNMLGETFTSINPDIQDAAAEICNQIFGGAKKVLNESGHTIQPAIPSVISGKRHQIRHPVGGTCIAVKFSTPVGNFQVEAVLTDRKQVEG
jgi:chemotaxis protein CheX